MSLLEKKFQLYLHQILKGTPGVSLLLTYRRDGSDTNKLANFLEPSIGANVSYLDFSTDDDVEVGAGLVLGFF